MGEWVDRNEWVEMSGKMLTRKWRLIGAATSELQLDVWPRKTDGEMLLLLLLLLLLLMDTVVV